MAEFVVNPQRFDPYQNFKFRVEWDDRIVAGVSKVSGLRRTTEVITHREGGGLSAERKSPGRTEFKPIVLERGVTHDHGFELWANKVWPTEAVPGAELSLKNFRKNVRIERAMLRCAKPRTLSRISRSSPVSSESIANSSSGVTLV
jgi:phage tail-like protein